ncbi:hypothetical protein ACFY0G_02065 [Streptomyces sp. NPDC001552]|uniref:hypothetical protein n=1 Tax=Streptomyces sp. NPDC001552 TaxID=3364587 RepID=UPI003680C5D8
MNAPTLFIVLSTLAACDCVPKPHWLRLYIPPHQLTSPFSPPGTPPDGPAHRKDTPS